MARQIVCMGERRLDEGATNLMSEGSINLRILVIDDNAYMRVIVLTLLRALGIREVRECEDGADAFSLLRTWKADVILIDQHMQPISGLEFAHLLRRGTDLDIADIPLILLTAHTDRATVESARDLGIDEVLAKPLAASALLQRLSAVIENRRRFLRLAGYIGPDRRRRVDPRYRGPKRRATDGTGAGDALELD
jgi:two-component system, chemotaxis family, chemotaxis protein CheY